MIRNSPKWHLTIIISLKPLGGIEKKCYGSQTVKIKCQVTFVRSCIVATHARMFFFCVEGLKTFASHYDNNVHNTPLTIH